MLCIQKKVFILARTKQIKSAMKKEKIHLEYLLNATSKNILWGAISTPTGLENWFADKVVSDDKNVEFHWGKTEHRLRSEEHTSELQSRQYLVCRLLLEKKQTI